MGLVDKFMSAKKFMPHVQGKQSKIAWIYKSGYMHIVRINYANDEIYGMHI